MDKNLNKNELNWRAEKWAVSVHTVQCSKYRTAGYFRYQFYELNGRVRFQRRNQIAALEVEYEEENDPYEPDRREMVEISIGMNSTQKVELIILSNDSVVGSVCVIFFCLK